MKSIYGAIPYLERGLVYVPLTIFDIGTGELFNSIEKLEKFSCCNDLLLDRGIFGLSSFEQLVFIKDNMVNVTSTK